MTATREELRHGLLLDGLIEPVNLARIHSEVRRLNPSKSEAQWQQETLAVIRSLVGDGLMDVGYLGDRFVPKPLDEIMPVIQDAYITHYRDTGGWVFSYWLNLTDKGRQVALSTEEGRRVAEHEKRRRASLRRQR